VEVRTVEYRTYVGYFYMFKTVYRVMYYVTNIQWNKKNVFQNLQYLCRYLMRKKASEPLAETDIV
jgi:hypothetical protein